MDTTKTDILILGAGIGGLETFRTLNKLLKKSKIQKKITLVDQNNYFTFVPLMHEVAAGTVTPDHCTVSLRDIVAGTGHDIVKARVLGVDPTKKTAAIQCSEGGEQTISYEYCVVALGSGINYFGVPGAPENTFHLRSLDNALAFRNALIHSCDTPAGTLSISVVGGGYTGVEAAGHIASLVGRLKRLYPKKSFSLNLIERNGALATMLPPKAQALIATRLKKLGVTLYLNTGVAEVQPSQLVLTTGGTLQSDITLWAVGFKSFSDTLLPLEFSDKGRIMVSENLTAKTNPSLYAVGDIALFFNPESKQPMPQLGEAAHVSGEYVARHLAATLTGKTIAPFRFASKGSLLPIGENYGILVFGNIVISGFFAWWVRRTVYVMFIPGFLRKLRIIADWTLRLFGHNDIISFNQKN